uniref:BPTI/Kunitz inhibitor domain-containing protein n=1 Tax=Heterorhabditis bacteriophora TaxID=37862 RepID=A0A1I7XKR0_HETBA
MFFIIFVLVLLPITNALNCSSKKEVGFFCEQPSSKMFYYDSRYKVCQPFQYRGCGGNDNQFNTAQECREQCSNGGRNENSTQVTGAGENESGVDTVFRPLGTGHDQWLKAEKCGSNFLIPNGKYIKCGSGCPSNHSCIMGVCCPSEDYVCSLIDDTGSFVDGINDKPSTYCVVLFVVMN